jgi:hypothetical protein
MEMFLILLRTRTRMRRYLVLIQNRIQTQNLPLHQREDRFQIQNLLLRQREVDLSYQKKKFLNEFHLNLRLRLHLHL